MNITVTTPRNYTDPDGPGIRVEFPLNINVTPQFQADLLRVIQARTGVAHMGAEFHLAGERPYAVFRPIPQAPERVTLADVADAIAAAPDTRPVIGMAKRREIVSVDLEDESPHILISAGSGGGKSILARILIAQFLARGARVIVCDRKRISHRWVKDIPGVEYYRDTEQIHDVLIKLGATGDTRNKLTDDEDREFQRIVLVFEEMNATTGKLRAYWEAIREKDEPKKSPAIEALGDLVNMGRQVAMHVVAIGQRIEAGTLGGGSVRESFGIRLLSRYTLQTWKMLCADVWPMPKKSSIRGRWQFVANGEAREVQVAFLTDAEAQLLAAQRRDQVGSVGTGTESRALKTDLVTLKQAFGDDYERLRRALTRGTDTPEPVVNVPGGANLYARAELQQWRRSYDARPRLDQEVMA